MPAYVRLRHVRSLRLVAVVIAALTTLAPLAVAHVANAESVSDSKSALAEVRRKAAAARAELEAGTRQLEKLQSRARDLNARARQAQLRSTRLSAALDEMRGEIGAIAAAAYRDPLGGQFPLVLGHSPTDVSETLRALGYLDVVAARRGDVLRRTQVTRLAAETARDEAKQYAAGAAKASAAAQREVSQLQARSAKLAAELEKAVAQYAAAMERARLERERIAAERAAAERAARSRVFVGGNCAGGGGREWGGYPNGFIPEEALSPLDNAPGHRLRCDAAAAFNKMTAAYAADRGAPICVTDSYRSYSEQSRLYRSKPSMAAVPGTSNHGWALAVDLCGGVERFGSAAHEWMRSNAGRFGWVHPSWARQGGSRPEPWHWEFGNIS